MSAPQTSADLTQTPNLVSVGRLRPGENWRRPGVPAYLWLLRKPRSSAGGPGTNKQASACPDGHARSFPASVPATPVLASRWLSCLLGPDVPAGPALRTRNLQNRTLQVGIINLSRKELTSVLGPGKWLASCLGALRHHLQSVEGRREVGSHLPGLQG